MRRILLIFVCLQNILLFGQNVNLDWAALISGTKEKHGNGIAVDLQGNVYTVGTFSGTADFDPGPGTYNMSAGIELPIYYSDAYVSKLDAQGNFVWAIQFTSVGNGFNQGTAITTDHLGNIYIAGNFSRTVDFDPGVGVYNLTAVTASDLFMVKLDANGNFVWAKNIGAPNSQHHRILQIKVDLSQNVCITGDFDGTVDFDPGAATHELTSNGIWDIYVAKYDINGDFKWAHSFGNDNFDTGYSVAFDATGNVYVTGRFRGAIDFDPGIGIANLTTPTGHENGFVLKLDLNGNFAWVNHLTAAGNGIAGQSIRVDSQNNVIVSGNFNKAITIAPGISFTGVGTADVFVAKWDNNGNIIWGKQFVGTANASNQEMVLDANDNIYTIGHFVGTVDFDPGAATYNVTSKGGWDTYISKLNSNGDFVFGVQIGGTTAEYSGGLTIDAAGKLYATGRFYGTTDFDPSPAVYNLTSVGTTINESDVYTVKLSQSNCTKTGVDVKTACGTYTWINGVTYTNSNNSATHTITNGAVNGCDSIVTLNLTINQPATKTITEVACNSFTWTNGNGQTYTSSTTATHTITNGAVNGCDSIVTLNLTINQPATKTVTEVACNSYTWTSGNGQTYTSNTTATHTIANGAANGCDSIVTLNLTINQPATKTVTEIACNSFTWTNGNGQTYTSSATATHTITNGAANGCDSIVTLNLTIELIDNTVSQNGNTLTANQDGATYQWIDCANDLPIEGAQNQTFEATINGSYAVEITNGTCVETSSCINITGIGVAENEAIKISVFPNPSAGVFNIINNTKKTEIRLVVYNSLGQQIVSKNNISTHETIDLSNEAGGIYFVKLLDKEMPIAVSKIIKN